MTPTAEDVAAILRGLSSDHKVFGYFADMRGHTAPRVEGGAYGGCLMFVFECPHGQQAKGYGT